MKRQRGGYVHIGPPGALLNFQGSQAVCRQATEGQRVDGHTLACLAPVRPGGGPPVEDGGGLVWGSCIRESSAMPG